jgi:hypothetical protein
MVNRSYLKKVVKLVGSQALLAKLVNKIQPGAKLTQAHIWKWINSTALGIPGEYVISACHVVNWQVTPHQLRPDLYPHPSDGLPEHMRIESPAAAS